MTPRFGRVVTAMVTPFDAEGALDLDAAATLADWLVTNGSDGLVLCGTTGEATSFSVSQRIAIMRAAAGTLPLDRLLVGTGAAAVGDAVELTTHAARLGFAGALVLPPFYYKGVSADGILRYFDRIVAGTATDPIAIYLYNFPLLSGVEFEPALVRRLRQTFGERIAGPNPLRF